MNIENAVALVTGGNRGIGLGFVTELLKAGAKKVYIGCRSLSEGEAIATENPKQLVAVALDVTRPETIENAAMNCTDVSLLVNNAGAFINERLIGAKDMSAMRTEMEVNYFGVVAMCRAFAPVLKRNGGGAIVNVLSAGGIVAVPGMGGYSPSKFASRAASTCIRAELAGQGTTVSALIVGSVDTRMASHIKREKSTPEAIARAGIAAARNGVDEMDTDPHAMEVRAALARDPKALEHAMAAQVRT
ncbi:SDR family oxidoreductase [Kordiimonas pumila]|uniref:SDR family oxidoreductase n=1 Tax=Kordiimonas pumila TaxID=2161677 RepID=A0ABV7D5X8_9PROT|nr:SDR family oxidoreductase [Kordiimonas pumila]